MFPNPELEKFSPDIIYICTSNRNITDYPQLTDSGEQVEQKLSDRKSTRLNSSHS